MKLPQLPRRMNATYLMDSRGLVIHVPLVRMCNLRVAAEDRAVSFLRKVNFIRHLPDGLTRYKKYAEFYKGSRQRGMLEHLGNRKL